MDKAISFTPVATPRASEAICAQIREKILDGELKPGDRLPSERAMMDMFRRSRPTIREALRMLERSDLIHITPGSSGATVKEPSITSVEQPLESMLKMGSLYYDDLIEFRRVNASVAAHWAADRRTDEDLKAMRENLEKAAQATDDMDLFIALDDEFHLLITIAAKNDLLLMFGRIVHRLVNEILHNAYEEKSPEERQMMCREILETHHRIYDAIAAKDAEIARATVREHIISFSKDIALNKAKGK